MLDFARRVGLRALPTDHFVRVHRSYVVAINKINRFERHQLMLNNRKVPVSEAYRQNFLAILTNKQALEVRRLAVGGGLFPAI